MSLLYCVITHRKQCTVCMKTDISVFITGELCKLHYAGEIAELLEGNSLHPEHLNASLSAAHYQYITINSTEKNISGQLLIFCLFFFHLIINSLNKACREKY